MGQPKKGQPKKMGQPKKWVSQKNGQPKMAESLVASLQLSKKKNWKQTI